MNYFYLLGVFRFQPAMEVQVSHAHWLPDQGYRLWNWLHHATMPWTLAATLSLHFCYHHRRRRHHLRLRLAFWLPEPWALQNDRLIDKISWTNHKVGQISKVRKKIAKSQPNVSLWLEHHHHHRSQHHQNWPRCPHHPIPLPSRTTRGCVSCRPSFSSQSYRL